MKYIDLFSGAGGLSLGFKNAGFDLVYSNEIDKYAVKTQRKNLEFLGDDPNKVISCSIEDLHSQIIGRKINFEYQGEKVIEHGSNKTLYSKAEDLIEKRLKNVKEKKDIDLIIGGPPCQGFSAASKGKKSFQAKDYKSYIDDPRNQLFKYFLDFVSFYNPKIVLIENVKGLVSSSNYKLLIESSLQNSGNGYNTYSQLLSSARFGVPQLRERLFFIGIRKDINESEELAFYLDSLIHRQSHKKISVFEAINDLPSIRSNPKQLNTKIENEIKIGKPNSFGENVSTEDYISLVNNQSEYVINLNYFRGKKIIPDKLYNHKCRFNNDNDLKIYSLLIPGKILTHAENKEALKLVKYSTDRFADKYYKIDPDKPSRTIVAHLKNDNNGYIHYGKTPRGISPREAARIQSFPDWYKFEGPLSFQFKQIGNAVPPKVAYVFAKIFHNFLTGGIEKAINSNNN